MVSLRQVFDSTKPSEPVKWPERLRRAAYSELLEPPYRAFAKTLAHLIYRPTYLGFEKIPKTGPLVIIANHVSYVDGLVIAAGIDRPVRFVIDGHIYNAPFVHYVMVMNRAIPILPNRESVTASLEAISEGLKAGDAICIFPEGQLTYTGSLGRFRPGIEWIIKRDQVPVYPVALTGLWGSVFSRKYRNRKFRWWPKKWGRTVRAVCGERIEPENVSVNALQEAVLKLKYFE